MQPPVSIAAGKTRKYPDPKACMQCGTTRTPVWREGPYGLKTLCNACGVKRVRAIKAQQQGAKSSTAAAGEGAEAAADEGAAAGASSALAAVGRAGDDAGTGTAAARRGAKRGMGGQTSNWQYLTVVSVT
jgi:hypothetical protein